MAADEGNPAPEFKAKLFNGEDFSLTKSSGNVVLIHFWATWCEACQKEMSALDEYYKLHRTEGFKLIAISMDDKEAEGKARDNMKKFSFDAAFGRAASFKAYGRIWKIPMNFLIDRKGILQKDGWTTTHTLNSADLDSTVTPFLKLH